MWMNYREPLFRPPAEAYSFIVQAAYGCPYNTCAFCGMYKGKKYSVRAVNDVLHELKQIPAKMRSTIKRIFVADGDVMACGGHYLRTLFDGLGELFPNLKRISVYASPLSVLNYSEKELAELHGKKLYIAYIGLESGHDELLKFTGKTNQAEDFVRACRALCGAGIRVSATAILGLGGKSFTKNHAIQTAKIVNQAIPTYFSLLTLIHGGNEDYVRKLELLSRLELFEELREIVSHISVKTIFRTDHASNLIRLNGNLPRDKDLLLANLDSFISSVRDREYYTRTPEFYGESGY